MRLILKATSPEGQVDDYPEQSNIVEYHRIQFERYFKPPYELVMMKQKVMEQARTNPKIAQQIREEEIFNPWIITDFDETMSGNPHTKTTIDWQEMEHLF